MVVRMHVNVQNVQFMLIFSLLVTRWYYFRRGSDTHLVPFEVMIRGVLPYVG